MPKMQTELLAVLVRIADRLDILRTKVLPT
jgi:hypothetical protein